MLREGKLGGRRRSLLSMLMNQDPRIFRSGRPYRTSLSSGDFSSMRGNTARSGNSGAGGGSALGCNRVRALRRFLLLRRLVPVVGVTGNSSSRRYRPEGQEMKNDSESGEENADDPIQVSWSVAQRRLALLASGRKTMPTMANTTTVVANPVMMNVKTDTDDDANLTPHAHLQE
jgi:hypothetical protein